jgi:hypothetical protein
MKNSYGFLMQLLGVLPAAASGENASVMREAWHAVHSGRLPGSLPAG